MKSLNSVVFCVAVWSAVAGAQQVYELPALTTQAIEITIPGESLQSLTTPTIQEAGPAVMITANGDATYGLERHPYELQITLYPGPSFSYNSQVLSLVIGASGTLTTGSDTWLLDQQNSGSFMAKAHHHPETGHLGFFLPFRAESNGLAAWVALIAKCDVTPTPTCEGFMVEFDRIRADHSPELLSAAATFGWTPTKLVPRKGGYLDCCFGPFGCCCASDCTGGNACPGFCSTCNAGACYGCQSWLGCGSCSGCS